MSALVWFGCVFAGCVLANVVTDLASALFVRRAMLRLTEGATARGVESVMQCAASRWNEVAQGVDFCLEDHGHAGPHRFRSEVQS